MNILILLIALLEWFTTLSVQIIAIRDAVPIAGSSIILTSIYIWIILMALSVWYYLWWVVANKRKREKLPLMLAFYLWIAWIYYGLITFWAHIWLLETLLETTWSYIFTLFVVAIALFFIPVAIAAQTIPLLSEISTFTSKWKATWSILFWSTIWSFLWSVWTSIVLFQTVWVVWTSTIVVIVMFLCTTLSLIIYKKSWTIPAVIVFAIASLAMVFVWQSRQPTGVFSFDSAYQQIVVRDVTIDWAPWKVFHTNGAFASAIVNETKTSPFGYIRDAVSLTKTLQPENVLVIWTAWFTYPYEISQLDAVKSIDAIDIDPSVKRIAEEHFLDTQLSDKITFYPQSARYFINQAIKNNKTYDLILVDAFNGKTLPNELLTYEFYDSLQTIADPERIVFNMILDRDLTSNLSKNIITTLTQARDQTVYIKNVSQYPNAPIVNFLLSWKQHSWWFNQITAQGNVYTDNLRSSEIDMLSFIAESF